MAEETTSTAEVNDIGTPDLSTMEQEYLTGEIETMLNNANRAVGQQGATDPDEATNVEGDGSDEADANVSSTEPNEATNVDKGAPGIDTALQFLDENNPDLAGVVRAQIRDNQSLRGRVKTIEENLESAVQAAVQEAMAQDEHAVVEEEPGAYTPEQIEQAKEVMRSMGVLLKEDVEHENQQKSLEDYLSSAVDDGVKRFGDMFGRVEDGKPVLSEGALDRIKSENQRIQQYGTITAKDLFVLSHFDELIKAAEDRGRTDGGNTNYQRARKLNGATSATTTSPAQPMANIRGEKGTASDSFQAVGARAWQEARKKLGL